LTWEDATVPFESKVAGKSYPRMCSYGTSCASAGRLEANGGIANSGHDPFQVFARLIRKRRTGEPTLLAAYTCTPLVTIALKDLKDGAHVVGKTIGELGWGSYPVDMVTFDSEKGPMGGW
jgi:hypothetical protein